MASKSTSIEWLRSVPLFSELGKGELLKVAAHLREDWFNPGEDIVTAAETDGRFYVITSGRAKVIANGRTVRTIGPGGFFGEMSLLDGSPRSATVRAETQVHTLWLGRVNFLVLLEENWKMAAKVLADLCARVRVADRSHLH